jgi:hypothetical protein
MGASLPVEMARAGGAGPSWLKVNRYERAVWECLCAGARNRVREMLPDQLGGRGGAGQALLWPLKCTYSMASGLPWGIQDVAGLRFEVK